MAGAVASVVVEPAEVGRLLVEIIGQNVGIALACVSKWRRTEETSDGRTR